MLQESKRGFTLVELSIVLVIVGLLIGGILTAQSMLSAARIQKQIQQFQQFDMASVNFQQTFKSFPGDSTMFTPVGDSNGIITQTIDGGVDPYGFRDIDGTFDYETAACYKHLQNAGMLPPKPIYSETIGSILLTTGGTINAPQALNSKNAMYCGSSNFFSINGYACEDGGPVFNNAGLCFKNAWVITTSSFPCNAGCLQEDGKDVTVPVNEILAIDKKIDDAITDTGIVRITFYGNGTTYNDVLNTNIPMAAIRMMEYR